MKILLLPLATLYGFIVWIRNRFFDYGIFKSQEFPIPVISIGNITVGGTGKTPHVEYLIKNLHPKYKLCVVSRGYKRHTKGIVEVTSSSTFRDVGDEPKQIKQKFPNVSVVVSASRVKAIQKILSGELGNQPDLIILDDAYQHRWVKPGFSILLVDFNRPIYKDFYLPLGELRESETEKHRADMVIITKTPEKVTPIERRLILKHLNLYPHQTLLYSHFVYGDLLPLAKNLKKLSVDFCLKHRFSAVLVTGIANPIPLKEFISEHFEEVEHLSFSDHYEYTNRDFQKILDVYKNIKNSNKIIITTEKDAVRLISFLGEENLDMPIYYLPVEVNFLDEEAIEFMQKIESFILKNRRKYL